MRLSAFLLVLLVSVYPVKGITSPSSVAAEEEQRQLRERPRLSVMPPVVMVLVSTVVVGCFVWVGKYCAQKIYQYIARPRWSAQDWRNYRNFIRGKGDFSGFFYKRTFDDRTYDDFASDYGRKGGQRTTGNQYHGYHQQGGKSPYTRDPYEVLELNKNASMEEIKKKYRQLVIKHHPDKNPGDPSATDRFREIANAYEKLTNR